MEQATSIMHMYLMLMTEGRKTVVQPATPGVLLSFSYTESKVGTLGLVPVSITLNAPFSGLHCLA